MKILVVEDDEPIRDLIDINLQMAGYDVVTAKDGEEARIIFDKDRLDLILLDVMIPKMDGFELISYLKKKDIPVIFITAKESVLDRVKGLRLGADDYIVKPFENIELLARVEAVSRRYGKSQSIIKFKNIEINEEERRVKLKDELVDMTIKEFDLLILFIKNKNIALSREQILERVWGYDYLGETRTVDIHVQRIREKLDLRDHIKTVFKIGYRFED